MNALLSPENLALAQIPDGAEQHQFSTRADWLAMRDIDVTASAAGALFGIHPYQTAYGLWAIKAGKASDEVDGDPVIDGDTIRFPPVARGNLFERPAIEALRLARPTWAISYPLNRYWRMPSARIGATPDALATDPERAGFGVVQVKTVAPQVFRETWRDPDTGEIVPPLWIALQALVEAKLTGASWACVVALVVDYDCRLIIKDIPLSLKAWDGLVQRVAVFWEQVETGGAPDPDFLRDAPLIMRLAAGDAPEPLDLRDSERMAVLLTERASLKEAEAAGSAAEKVRKALDAELVHTLGNHASALLPGGAVLSAPTIRIKESVRAATSYRRITIKSPPQIRKEAAE